MKHLLLSLVVLMALAAPAVAYRDDEEEPERTCDGRGTRCETTEDWRDKHERNVRSLGGDRWDQRTPHRDHRR